MSVSGPTVGCALLAAFAIVEYAPRAEAFDFYMQADAAYSVNVTTWRDLPFRTVVRQRYDFSCGSAALATLLTYHYNRPIEEADMFAAMYNSGDQTRISARGFSLLDMQRELGALGLKADGYRMSFAAFAKLNTPAIAMISPGGYRHFVVVKGLRDERVLVGDPAVGLTIYRRADFERLWNGIIFVIHDTPEPGAFNRPDEWAQRPAPPYEMAAATSPIDHLTREFSPRYQITPIIEPVQ